MESRADIAAVIRDAREGKRITQADLCRTLGMSRMTLNQIEKGERNFSIDTLLKIAGQLDLNIELTKMNTMKNFELEQKVLDEFMQLIDETDSKCEVASVVELENDVKLIIYRFHYMDGGKGAASIIYYPNGDVASQRDWQSGHPDCLEDIERFDWIICGRDAVIMDDGLPHII